MTRVDYPKNGLVRRSGDRQVFTVATGLNGTGDICALYIHDDAKCVTLRPVGLNLRISMHAWLEIPRDPATLRRIARALAAIAAQEGDQDLEYGQS